MSEQIKTFKEVFENNFSRLDLFTSKITRAHGVSHPEAFEVRSLFETIKVKVAQAGIERPNLDSEFTQLQKVTNNYKIPEDVCHTYAGVYIMLAEADKSYHD